MATLCPARGCAGRHRQRGQPIARLLRCWVLDRVFGGRWLQQVSNGAVMGVIFMTQIIRNGKHWNIPDDGITYELQIFSLGLQGGSSLMTRASQWPLQWPAVELRRAGAEQSSLAVHVWEAMRESAKCLGFLVETMVALGVSSTPAAATQSQAHRLASARHSHGRHRCGWPQDDRHFGCQFCLVCWLVG